MKMFKSLLPKRGKSHGSDRDGPGHVSEQLLNVVRQSLGMLYRVQEDEHWLTSVALAYNSVFGGNYELSPEGAMAIVRRARVDPTSNEARFIGDITDTSGPPAEHQHDQQAHVPQQPTSGVPL